LDSFGRIGTFQWVTGNPNIKSFSPCRTGTETSKPLWSPVRKGLPTGKEFDSGIENTIAVISDFRNKFPALILWLCEGRGVDFQAATRRAFTEHGRRDNGPPVLAGPPAMSQRADAGAVYLRSIASRTERRVAAGSRAGRPSISRISSAS
jgi:hypothetical protein